MLVICTMLVIRTKRICEANPYLEWTVIAASWKRSASSIKDQLPPKRFLPSDKGDFLLCETIEALQSKANDPNSADDLWMLALRNNFLPHHLIRCFNKRFNFLPPSEKKFFFGCSESCSSVLEWDCCCANRRQSAHCLSAVSAALTSSALPPEEQWKEVIIALLRKAKWCRSPAFTDHQNSNFKRKLNQNFHL